MKRYLLCTICMATVFVAKPQSFKTMFSPAYEGVTAEIVAGFNTSDLMVETVTVVGGTVEDFKQHPGFNVGVNIDIPLFEGFYLKPGLSFTTRGGNFRDMQDDDHYVRTVHSAYYLQMPVLASFRLGDIDNAQFQLNVGPYFAAGLFGGSKLTAKMGRVENVVESEYFYKEFDDIYADGFVRRFDCGLTFVAAMLFIEHIYVGVQYDLGLYNIAKELDIMEYRHITNGNFSVQVGYRF